MNHDSLPAIAVLGAGPVGLEAALYGRFLGYPVTVLEQNEVASNVRQWGSVTLFTPFSMNHSSLGRSAIEAQQPGYTAWPDDQLHTGQQWFDHYLGPLSRSDLLRPVIRTGCRVCHVTREGQWPMDPVGSPARTKAAFRIEYEDSQGRHADRFRCVIDATGTWNQPNRMGNGGGPALGEEQLLAARQDIPSTNLFCQHCPTGQELDGLRGDRFVLVGSGFTAATSLLQLERLRQTRPGLSCLWLTRKPGHPQPLEEFADDRLPERKQLARAANRLASSADWVCWRAGSRIESVNFTDQQFRIQLTGEDQERAADHLISNTGFHGDYGILEQLQVLRCHASGGPMNRAASRTGNSRDCLDQTSAGPEAVATSEPGLFVIGSKSYGRDSRFLFATGLQQIRDVYRVIGRRDDLDLYATMAGRRA